VNASCRRISIWRISIDCSTTWPSIGKTDKGCVHVMSVSTDNMCVCVLPTLPLMCRRFRESRAQLQPNSIRSLESFEVEFQRINTIIRTSKNEKNVEILPLTADLTRRLQAGRLTCCKSAKDRTSMSITWEQARILSSSYVKSLESVSSERCA
jgi:hypothetical protein